MTTIMFQVGIHDYSHRVCAENYNIGSYPEYELWTDANGKEHRSKYRTRIKGTLDMRFLTINEYQDFVTILENAVQSDLTYSITVYDNITEQEQEITAFIDYEPIRYRGADWGDMIERLTLNIREQ